MAAEGALGLVLPGGGARAAYQVGALKAVAEITPPGPSPFRVVAGQSAGAINAAGLACRAGDFQAAVAHMAAIWGSLSVGDVVRADATGLAGGALRWTLTAASGGWLVENPRSLLDNGPLARLLAREIDFDGIEREIAAGRLDALAITASAYARRSGGAVTFYAARAEADDWRRTRRTGLRRALGPEHVLASSALPFLFPATRIEGVHYGDGALRLTAPLSPAIRLGASRLLVIAARDPEVDVLGGFEPAAYPRLGEIAGHLLDIVFNDHLDQDVERLQRVNATLGLLTPEQRALTPLREVEVLVLRPSQDLREIAGRHARSLPWTLRSLLRGIGGWGGDWRLPSYLNFDAGFCGELMALGHADAMARRAEIEALLALAPASPVESVATAPL